MSKATFIILFSITWIFSYISIPIKFASLSTNIGADETLKLVAIVLAVIYTCMSFITYKWGHKTNKVWLVSFPIIAGFFEVLNIPILPSILCLITLIIGAIISPVTSEGISGEPDAKFKAVDTWEKSRDLSDDGYKIYLAKKYNIEKNNALDKILADGKLFDSINDALVAMDAKDSSNQKIISNSTQVVGDLTELDLTSKTQNKFIESSGSIGDGAYPYVEYLDGAVVVENKSGGKIHYSSLQKAKQVLGN